jgi:hypothetical protein
MFCPGGGGGKHLEVEKPGWTRPGISDTWAPPCRPPSATRPLARLFISPLLTPSLALRLRCPRCSRFPRSRQPRGRSSLSPPSAAATRERERESRHGRRGGRGRRDGRRPEAAHVRGRVSAYPSTPTFSSPALFLLRRVPCRLRSRIRDLLVPAPGRASGFARLLSPPGFPFSRLPSCVCPAGSRGGGFGFVPVIGDQGMHSRCWEHRVVVSRA